MVQSGATPKIRVGILAAVWLRSGFSCVQLLRTVAHSVYQ